jgi:hypothetical protein
VRETTMKVILRTKLKAIALSSSAGAILPERNNPTTG